MKKFLLFLFCCITIGHVAAQTIVNFSVKGADGFPLPSSSGYRILNVYRAKNLVSLLGANSATFSVGLPTGQYTYELTADGDYPAYRGTLIVGDTPSSIDISYENYSLATFNVRNESSLSVPDAEISVSSPTGDLLVRKNTNINGNMSVYLPNITTNDYEIKRPGYISKFGQVAVNEVPVTVPCDYVGYYLVSFSAKNSSNEAITDRLNLTLYNAENSIVHTSNIDATGRLVVYMEALSYRYLVTPEPGSFYTDKTGEITVTSSGETVNLIYDDYQKVIFTIEDAAEIGLDNADVRITNLNEIPQKTQSVFPTANPGGYITFLPNGNYLYEIERYTAGELHLSASFSVNNASKSISVVLYQVSFNVRGFDDGGIKSNILIYDQNNKNISKIETSSDGNATLDLPAGSYTYRVESDGYSPQTGSLTVNNTTPAQQVSFSARKKVTFRLKNTENADIDGQEVAIYQADKLVTKTSSIEHGEAVAYLMEGDYTYDISMAKRYPLTVNADQVENVTLAELTFNVTDKENMSISSLSIDIFDKYNNNVYSNPFYYNGLECYIKDGDYRYVVSVQDGNYPERIGEFTILGASKILDINFNDCNKVEFIINNPGDAREFAVSISDGQSAIAKATTSGDGKAVLYLPDGNYQYDVYRDPNIYSGLSGYIPSSGTLVVDGEAQSKQISFENYYEVTVEIRKSDNGVVSDGLFQISILDQNGKEIGYGSSEWNFPSRYTFMMPSGNYRYEASGFQEAKKTGDFTVEDADRSINIMLENYHKVAFKITCESEMPKYVGIRIFNDTNNDKVFDSSSDYGEVYLPDGTYTYEISGLKDLENLLPKRPGIFTVFGTDITVPVSYAYLYAVTFNVTDADGKKVTAIGVRILDEDENELYHILPGALINTYLDYPTLPEDNILMLPMGVYTYEVYTDKLAKKTGTVTVTDHAIEEDISYAGSGRAIFTASDINGKKLPLINISIKSGSDLVANYTTDHFGQAVFYLSEGTYSFIAEKTGSLARSGELKITDGDTKIDLSFADVTVSGTVTSQGSPISPATVLAYPLQLVSGKTIAGEPVSITTTSSGNFSVTIPAGKYYFYAEATGYLPAYFNSTGSVSGWAEANMLDLTANTSTVNIQLERIPSDIESGNIVIEGSVYDILDIERGSLKARVALNSTVGIYRSTKSAQKADDWVLVKTVRPDVDGNYRFTNLPEGVYRVVVDIPGYTFEANSVEIDAKSGKTYTIDDFLVDSEAMTITQNITSSVKVSDDIQLNIYPNPVTDVVYIEGLEGDYIIKVINMLGQTVITKKESAAKAILNLSNQPNGIYMIKIETQGTPLTRKLIKR